MPEIRWAVERRPVAGQSVRHAYDLEEYAGSNVTTLCDLTLLNATEEELSDMEKQAPTCGICRVRAWARVNPGIPHPSQM